MGHMSHFSLLFKIYKKCDNIILLLKKGSGIKHMDDPLACILIIGLCIVLHYFFSLCETALACVNRFKMQIKADDGSKTAKQVLRLTDPYDNILTTVLICMNIVVIISSAVCTVAFRDLFISSGMNDSTIALLASITITLLIYILGDALPKTIARSIPDTTSLIVIWPLSIFYYVLYPISLIFSLITKAIEKIFKVKKEDDFNEEDFESVVEKVSDEGVLEEEQGEIIQSALDFVDTNVKEVLTPKNRIYAIDIKNLNYEYINKILLESNYSRLPIYENTRDNIVGVLVIKNYIDEYLRDNHFDIRSIIQKPYFVPSTIMIDDLFNGFKKNHTHIAFVQDKNKKLVGMVTMDDVLEELVSDISEPHNTKAGV